VAHLTFSHTTTHPIVAPALTTTLTTTVVDPAHTTILPTIIQVHLDRTLPLLTI